MTTEQPTLEIPPEDPAQENLPTENTPLDSTVDKSNERIRKMFGEISPRYDFMNHFLSGGTDLYWRWRAVRMAPPEGTAPILDVCTGTGDLAFAWWKKSGGQIPVFGTDFTAEMVALAREKQVKRKIAETGEPAMHFLEADTQQLPFESNLFQIVSVAFGLRNVCDTRQGLAEMLRVCQPGGRIVILEFSMPRNKLFGAAYRSYFKHVLPRIGQLFARNRESAYKYLPDSVSDFPHGPALVKILEETGMTDVKWKSLTGGIAALYCGRKPMEPVSNGDNNEKAAL